MKNRSRRPAPRAAHPGRDGRRHWLIPAMLVLAVVATFGRTIAYEFVEFDDGLNVYENPGYHPVSAASLAAFWEKPYKGLYIPMAFTVYGVEAMLSPKTAPDPAGRDLSPVLFHAGNVALHAACVLLVFGLLRRLTGHEVASAFGSLLFAVHPMQVESVAWISQMRGLLCMAFGLATIGLYLRASRADGSSGGPRRGLYALATMCFLLSLLSKPAAAAIPLVAAVIEVGWLGGSWRRTALMLVPWLVAAAGAAAITKGVQPGFDLPATGLVERCCVGADALVFYGTKVFAPVNLAPVYDRPIDHVLASAHLCWPIAALVVIAGVAALVPGRRAALVSIGIFAAALAPALGVVPFEYQALATVADRYAYLAMLAPAFGLAVLLSAYPTRAAFVAASVVAVALAVLSVRQAAHWQNDDALFVFALGLNPDSAEMNTGMGNVAFRRDDLTTAERYYRAALASRPGNSTAHRNLGLVLDRRGDTSAAIDEFRRAVEARPDFEDAYRSLGQALVKANDPAGAVNAYRRALALQPDDRPVYAELGVTLLGLERAPEAEALYREAVRRFPDWPHAHANLAVALAVQSKYAEAAAEAREALRLNPGMAEARDTLEKVQALSGAH